MKGEKFITGITVNLYFFEAKIQTLYAFMHCTQQNKMPGEFLIFTLFNCFGNKKI